MILKSVLYKNKQEEILDEIVTILDLENIDNFTLYKFDNDIDKQNALISLTPKIRQYFNYKSIVGIRNPEKTKRPYLSIIKCIIKIKYQIISKDFQKTVNKNKIRTTKYIFIKI